jgi:hypothetical protein
LKPYLSSSEMKDRSGREYLPDGETGSHVGTGS